MEELAPLVKNYVTSLKEGKKAANSLLHRPEEMKCVIALEKAIERNVAAATILHGSITLSLGQRAGDPGIQDTN